MAGWIDAWHRTIGQNQPLTVVVVFDADQPVLAAAFTQAQSQIRFAGQGPTDYSELIIDRSFEHSDQLHAAIDSLLATAHDRMAGSKWFKLGRIPVSSVTHRALIANQGRYHGVASTSVVAPHMSMSMAPAAMKKKSLKRHENKLKRRGSFAVETHVEIKPVLERLPVFFEQHQRRWSDVGINSPYTRSDEREFVTLCCEELARAGVLRFTEVLSAGEQVAFHFGFFHAGVYTWYKPSFDPKFSEFSPGEVLLKALIQRAQLDNATIFDFTIGNEGFKRRFADQYPTVEYLNVTDSPLRRTLFRGHRTFRSLSERLFSADALAPARQKNRYLSR